MNRSQPNETLRKRLGQSRAVYWLIFDANRWLVAAGGMVVTFIVLVVLGALDEPPLRVLMRTSDEIKTTAQAYITALITGVTIVIAINQLVISRELGPLGDQRERMAGVLEFRQDVEEKLLESVSPAEPAVFLRVLVDETVEHSHKLREAVADNETDDLKEKVRQFDESLTEHATEVSNRLKRTPFGQFKVIRIALDYNYSWKIHEIRQIRYHHWDALRESEREAFDEMVSVLALFAPARENFKTLYFRRELTRLSRSMLYTAFPSVIVALVVSLYLNASDFPGAILGVDNMIWLVSAVFAIGLLPFFLLAAYVIRIASVTELTLTVGPFILRESERQAGSYWNEADRDTDDGDDRKAGEESRAK